jgi:large subunit ribosomal protein L25
MAKRLLLEAEVRDQVGSKDASRIRKQGRIPAIVYGHKQQPKAISLNTHDFVEGLHHGHRLMDIKIDKKKETVLIKDLQYDELGKYVIHADLQLVDVTEMLKVSVPIDLKGIAKGTHEGGIVEAHVDSLEIECKATDIPEILLVSVKELELGSALHAVDVELPEGVKLASDPEILVATCHAVAVRAAEVEEVEEEEIEAPEVIGEVKEGEEGQPAEEKKSEESEK